MQGRHAKLDQPQLLQLAQKMFAAGSLQRAFDLFHEQVGESLASPMKRGPDISGNEHFVELGAEQCR